MAVVPGNRWSLQNYADGIQHIYKVLLWQAVLQTLPPLPPLTFTTICEGCPAVTSGK